MSSATVTLVDELDQAAGITRIQAEVSVLLRRARVYFRDAARDVHPDLQPAAYAILVRLVDDGPVRSSALAEHFATDKGAISRQVAQLEQLGFVRRQPDPDDRRASLIQATAEGTRRCRLAREHNTRSMRELLAQWSPDEIAQLGILLGKFNAGAGTPSVDPTATVSD